MGLVDIVFYGGLMVAPFLFLLFVRQLLRAPAAPSFDDVNARADSILAGQVREIKSNAEELESLKKQLEERETQLRAMECRVNELFRENLMLMNRAGASEAQLSARKYNLSEGLRRG